MLLGLTTNLKLHAYVSYMYSSSKEKGLGNLLATWCNLGHPWERYLTYTHATINIHNTHTCMLTIHPFAIHTLSFSTIMVQTHVHTLGCNAHPHAHTHAHTHTCWRVRWIASLSRVECCISSSARVALWEEKASHWTGVTILDNQIVRGKLPFTMFPHRKIDYSPAPSHTL